MRGLAPSLLVFDALVPRPLLLAMANVTERNKVLERVIPASGQGFPMMDMQIPNSALSAMRPPTEPARVSVTDARGPTPIVPIRRVAVEPDAISVPLSCYPLYRLCFATLRYIRFNPKWSQ